MKHSQIALLTVCAAGAFILPLAIRLSLQQWPVSSSQSMEVPANPSSYPVRQTSVDAVRSASPEIGSQRIHPDLVLDSPRDRIREQLPSPSGNVQLTNWQQALPGSVAPGEIKHTREYGAPELRPMVVRVIALTILVLVVCFVCLKLATGNSSGQSKERELSVCDSLALSREVGVKLIQIGNERIVVGHDRQGMRSMVLLPARFESVLKREAHAGQVNGALEIAGDLRMALANPEDRGWDLSRQ